MGDKSPDSTRRLLDRLIYELDRLFWLKTWLVSTENIVHKINNFDAKLSIYESFQYEKIRTTWLQQINFILTGLINNYFFHN